MLERLLDAYGDDIQFVFRHFPLNFHDKAVITSEAAEAAGAQGAFWEMHDLLYENYQEWAQASPEEMPEILAGYAEELELDVEQFSQALEEDTYEEKVLSQLEDATGMGLPGTPTFIVNGRMYPWEWGLSEQALNVFVEVSLLKPRQYDGPPPQVIDPSLDYLATIRTEKGDIVVELYPDQAPANVNSFVFLANDGWYDDVNFFRVVPDFVAQAGDPTNTGAGGPGYQCDDEISPGLSFDQVGVVGIANAGPNTGSCQFFITLAPNPELDGSYTIIGQVVEGTEVLESLTPRDPSNPEAEPGDTIETILIEEQ